MKRWNLSFAKMLLCGSLVWGLSATEVKAQQAKPVKILFLLDGSSSMLDDWQPGSQRFGVASKLIGAIVDSIKNVNPNVQFALRVFGHQYTVQENNCYDTKLEVPYSRDNVDQIKARLKYLSARGVSPIAYSLKKTAEENFPNSDRNAYSIILLTDGGESCGGNMCDEINYLLENKITFKPYILSLIGDYNLEKEYNCFGKFLTVARPEDMTPAIKTIIDDNRLMFEKNDGSLALVKPEPVKEEPKKEVVITIPKVDTPKPVVPVEPAPVPKGKLASIASFKTEKLRLMPYKRPSATLVKRQSIATTAKIKFTDEDTIAAVIPVVPEKPKPKAVIIGIKPKASDLKRIPNIWVYEPARPSKLQTKAVKLKFTDDEPEAPIATVTKPPATTPKPAAKTTEPQMKLQSSQDNAPVTVASVKSEDTKLLVYFTDGKGKYYKTEPKIDFVDVKTNKVVQSNYRLVNRSTGIPDPIKIPPGTYRITRAGSSFRSAVVNVENNTTSKVEVVVNKGSIAFRYEGNEKRPVVEFNASVSNPVEIGGPVVKQKCDELLEYDPGMYRVSINTLPRTERTLKDLKFGEVSVITIEEPGTFAISNSFKGRVQLWYQRGASFEPFHDMELSGNPADQKLDLLPGPYKVYFFKDGKEQMLNFKVKSNTVTNLAL